MSYLHRALRLILDITLNKKRKRREARVIILVKRQIKI